MGGLKVQQWILIVIGLIAVSALTIFFNNNYIGQEDKPVTRNYEKDAKPMIGFSVDGMVIERWQKDINILKTKAEELGFEVDVTNAYEDAEKQSEQIKTLVDEGAVAIFILPYDKDALTEEVEYAKDHGVLVISYDRLIANAPVDAYVSFDNVAVGELMATALIKDKPKGNYVIVNGSPTDNNAYMFNQGFYNILTPYIEAGDIKIIGEVWSENWREEYGIEQVRELLDAGETIDAVIGANDRLAEGVIGVLSEYGLIGSVSVVGHDADVSACQKIVEGKQLMTVYKPIKNLAEGAAELVYNWLNGEIDEADEFISNGSDEIPYYKFDVIAVDADNMRETVIKDLFHREEDVYRDQVGD